MNKETVSHSPQEFFFWNLEFFRPNYFLSRATYTPKPAKWSGGDPHQASWSHCILLEIESLPSVMLTHFEREPTYLPSPGVKFILT